LASRACHAGGETIFKDRVTSQPPKDQLPKIQHDPRKWMSAQGSLSDVLADADQRRDHSPRQKRD
jgi:hypothetical protein